MKRAIIPEPHHVAAVEAEPAVLRSGEVRIAVKACGICGSDLHTFEGRHPFVTYPVYPGHELSGTVVEVGTGVPETWAGQRITVEPSLVDGDCENCRAGRYNICERLRVMGFQAPGGMGEEFVVPVDRLVPLPAGITDEQGAFAEPVAVAVHAARLPASLIGRNILVLGAGTIGLLTAQVVRSYGAKRVVLTDLLPSRLALAARLGLEAVEATGDGLDALLVERFGGKRPDIAIECVGVEATIRQAIELVRKGGEIVVVGVFGQDVAVPVGLIQDRELQVKGSLMYTRADFEEAVRLISERKMQVDPLVTHRVALAAVDRAFGTATSRADAVKIIVIP